MSGVQRAGKPGIYLRASNPRGHQGPSTTSKMLVHVPSSEAITSYAVLETKLSSLEWERSNDDPGILQFLKKSTTDLISLPKDFNKFEPLHMDDIVVKNRNDFEVRDIMI